MMKMNRGSGGSPMEMMREMMGQRGGNPEVAKLLTPELSRLFEEWLTQLENEIIEKNEGAENLGVEPLAAQLGLSKESVIFLVARLATRDKVKLTISI